MSSLRSRQSLLAFPKTAFLAPSSFFIYVSDMLRLLNIQLVMFTDDTAIDTAAQNVVMQLQKQLDASRDWIKKWWISVNTSTLCG